MTFIQQLTFERIETINKLIREQLPDLFIRPNSNPLDTIALPKKTFVLISDLLYEQQNLIEALWDEERKDNNEN